MTAFVHTRVPLAGGLFAIIDGNSKITSANGTYYKPAPNAFSLPAASVDGLAHCPGSTPTCRASCYVRGLAKHAPNVYAAYQSNAALLDAVLANTDDGLWLASARALGAWIAANCAGGFRWHVSGDVRGGDHAAWISRVCFESPNVRHWIYTRTLSAVPALMLARNLTVNVSADRDNYADARDCAIQNGARLAYMATADEFKDVERLGPGAIGIPGDLLRMPHDSVVVFPDYPLRGRDLAEPTAAPYWQNAPHRLRVMTCPADFFGQSEAHRCGPCDKCIKPVAA